MELTVRANELHEQAVASFNVSERFAYDFIMKVKQIRDERLYKELGHSTFDSYCESLWNVRRGYMDDRILLAESFGKDFDRTYGQLGHSKSLLLARMEPEVRQKIEETVQVGQISVNRLKEIEKELQEAKQRVAKAESDAETERNSARHFEQLWNRAKNQPPRIEKQIVEVVPENIKKKLEKLEFENVDLRHGFKNVKEKLQQYELRDTDNYDQEKAQKELERLQKEADISTVELRIAFKNFIEKAAITSFLEGAIATASQGEKERLAELVKSAEQIVNQTKSALIGRRLGVVNE